MRTHIRRFAAAALVGALTLTTIGLTPAEARHWHRGNAAALGAVVGVFGTIAALAAADQYRDGYYGCYDCGGPYYAYPGPRYYGGGYRHWHHHHWR